MSGSAGVGKSTTIIAFAKKFYGESFDEMTLILNASEERGVDTIRAKVKQFVTTHGDANCKTFKMVIMDEMDSVTSDAQAILRKVIENYTYNVRFCFICNYIKKISIAIQNRCVIFKFKPIPYSIMYNKIDKVCGLENMVITKSAVNLIIKVANGDMRKILNILQSLNMIKQDYYNTENIKQQLIDNELMLNNGNDKQIINTQSILNNISNEQSILNNISNKQSTLNNDYNKQLTLNNDYDKQLINTPTTLNNDFIITETHVSKILSSPTQQMIIDLLLFIQTKKFKECHYYIISLFKHSEITLLELLHNVYDICMDYIINDNRNILKYPIDKVIKIINNLAIIDTNLSNCNDENIQIMSFNALFFL